MSRYRGWRVTVFVVSIVLAVFAPSTVAVVVANSLVEAPDNASDSGVPTHDPASTVSRTAEDSDQCPTAAAVTVDVRNVANVDGRAKRVLDFLKKRGFIPGEARDNSLRPSSVVRHAPGERGAGCRVAEALGGLPIEPDPNLAAGTVSVFLGKDYAGPGA